MSGLWGPLVNGAFGVSRHVVRVSLRGLGFHVSIDGVTFMTIFGWSRRRQSRDAGPLPMRQRGAYPLVQARWAACQDVALIGYVPTRGPALGCQSSLGSAMQGQDLRDLSIFRLVGRPMLAAAVFATMLRPHLPETGCEMWHSGGAVWQCDAHARVL